jgi:uncharacterized protein YhjY with autotransporter beta-barrel domain
MGGRQLRHWGVDSIRRTWTVLLALFVVVAMQGLPIAGATAQAAPAVTSVSVPANGYYTAGQSLTFSVEFSENVTVDTSGGTPRIPLTIGSTTHYLNYTGGSGSAWLSFEYTVQPGDMDFDGVQLGSAIDLNGSTIQNAANEAASPALNNVGSLTGVMVNTAAPTVTTAVLGNPPSNSTAVTFQIVFSESVTGLDVTDLVLTATGTATGTLSSLHTADNTTYTVLASNISGTGTLRLDVPANSAQSTGGYGNLASTGTPWSAGLSSNADLSQLQPSVGSLTPAFTSNVLSYSISVDNSVPEIAVTPTASEPNAKIAVNGTPVASGTASSAISLSVGMNTISVVVTAQDGATSQVYEVTVTRAASGVAELASLVPSDGTLEPSFSPTRFAYDIKVGNQVDSITFTPTVSVPTAMVAVKGAAVSSGAASAPIALSDGANQVPIVVTAQDGTTTRTYTVTVTRSKAAPAAASRTVQVLAGTTAIVDLTEGASGGPFTTAAITLLPSSDSGTVHLDGRQKQLTFDASPTFAGSAVVGFTLSNAFGTSAPATITFSVIARPDPSKDPEVVGLIRAQIDAAKRFAQYQTRNFNNRLEQLHDEGDRRRNSLDIRLGYRPSDSDGNRADYHLQPDQSDGSMPSLLGYSSDTNISSIRHPQSKDSTSAIQGPDLGRFAIWSGGFVDFADRDNGDLDIDSTAVGVSAGFDYRFSDRFVAGFGIGYGRERSDVGDNGTESRATAYSAAIYGSYKPIDSVFLDGLIGGSWLDFDSERYVTANGAFASGERDGRQIFGSLTAAYEFRNTRWLVSPYGRFELSRSFLDSFTEDNGGIYGLAYGDQTVDTAAGVLGIRASYAIKMDWGTLTPGVRAEFTHDFAGSSRVQLGYIDIGSLPYVVDADSVGADYATLGLSMDATLLNDWSIGLEYRTALGSGRQDHALGLKVGTRF